jgi:hypothetical protein
VTKLYISSRPDPIRKRHSRRALHDTVARARNEGTQSVLDRAFPDIEGYRQRRRDHLSLFLWLAIPTWVLISLALPWFWVIGFFLVWFLGSLWA